MSTILTRPDRDPDITFQYELSARPVSLWEKEGMFIFEDSHENNVHSQITFGGDIKHKPREFIEFTAQDTRYPNRMRVAQEYLMTLELEQLIWSEEVI